MSFSRWSGTSAGTLSAYGFGLMLTLALTYGPGNGGARTLDTPPTAIAWITFFAVVLSLLATLAGAALGRRRAAAHITHEIED